MDAKNSSSLVTRFGDMISETSLESIQMFEKRNKTRSCKDGIRWEYLNDDDSELYFAPKVRLSRFVIYDRLVDVK